MTPREIEDNFHPLLNASIRMHFKVVQKEQDPTMLHPMFGDVDEAEGAHTCVICREMSKAEKALEQNKKELRTNSVS